jgi:hypothetical protein
MTEPVPRSLHEHDFQHLQRQIDALDRLLSQRIDSVDKRHTELARERNRAIEAGLATANEKDKTHNDVLGAMKEQQATFVTKEEARMRFNSLAVAIAAIGAIFGIINAIRALGG